MNVVIYDSKTKEVIACVDTSGGDSILKNGYDFKLFNKTEPVFVEKEDKILLAENKFIIDM